MTTNRHRVVFTAALLAAGLLMTLRPEAFFQRGPDFPSEFLVIDLDGDGICLTSAAQGVTFRFGDSKTPPVRTAWICANKLDALLADDFTEDGIIGGGWELVGGRRPEPANGFDVLNRLDGRLMPVDRKVVGAPNGLFDDKDERFDRLILWTDTNHDGVSDEPELQSLAYAGFVAVDLHPKTTADTDQSGNVITRRGVAKLKRGQTTVDRVAITVRLAQTR